VISQVFGLFPISGIFSTNPKEIKFSWKSLRALFSLCFLLYSISISFLMFYRQSKAGPLTPSNIVGIIFFGSCALTCVLLYQFSLKFGQLMVRWKQVEEALYEANVNENENSWSLKKKVYICLTVGFLSALIEHLMSIAAHSTRVSYEIKMCNRTNYSAVEMLITKHLSFVFSVIKYNHFYGFLAEYLNFSLTFYWSFNDIFLMVISIGLSFCYNEIYKHVYLCKERTVPDDVWFNIRIQYNKVSELLKTTNDAIDKIIVLTCCNDAYFIMIQLLNTST
jgi:gustatory receptor